MIVYLDNLEIPSLSRIPRLSRATMVIKLAHTDMERLVDDCIVMDYGKILVQMPVNELLGKFRRYTAQVSEGFQLQNTDGINDFLLLLAIITLCYGILSVLSLTRFRDGRQD